MRRKYVQIVPAPRCASESQLQAVFENSNHVRFTGKAAETHRLFLFSSDLYHEAASAPWAQVPGWRVDYGSVAVKFMLSQNGPADILMFCDGRSRQCRAQFETMTQAMRHPSEIWLVFAPTPRMGRKVSFRNDNKEVILISSPVARTLLPVKERSAFAGAGELTTHDASYTGVPPMPWGRQPLLSPIDKEQILGPTPENSRIQLFDSGVGLPLFWAERKSPAFWRQLFADLSVGCVIDLTPGSGSAARAAMDAGVQYLAFARNAAHDKWLQCVLDRAALPVICASGSPLYHQDLAASVGEHFSDIVESLAEADRCEDHADEEDTAS